MNLIELIDTLQDIPDAAFVPVLVSTADGWMTVSGAKYDEDRVLLTLVRP